MVIVLYNPSSHRRKDYLKKACEIIKDFVPEDRACGYVRNIGREGEEATVLTFKELHDAEVDMFTTVFIGNSQSDFLESDKGRKLLTKRGYKL